MFSADRCAAILAEIRSQRPLVHNITNFVVMNNTANALLALGASPAMVHANEEVEEFVAISAALVVNIGTLSPPWVSAMEKAVRVAGARGIPWVLDPVGAGATAYRTRTSAALAVCEGDERQLEFFGPFMLDRKYLDDALRLSMEFRSAA